MNEAQVAQTAVSWVKRARAGDQVAMAALKKTRIEVESGKANARTKLAYQAAAKYIKSNPTSKIKSTAAQLGAPVEMSSEAILVDADAVSMLRKKGSDNRPFMPRGYLRNIDDPSKVAETVIGAQKYRDGMGACVVALAGGEPLTPESVARMGPVLFTTESQGAAFAHGAQFSGEADWNEAAPALPRDLRPCLLVGQCVGRAMRLQALRQPDSSISDYDPIIGWELGE